MLSDVHRVHMFFFSFYLLYMYLFLYDLLYVYTFVDRLDILGDFEMNDQYNDKLTLKI